MIQKHLAKENDKVIYENFQELQTVVIIIISKL